MIRFLTAGESHGPRLTAIMDGLPAGLPLGPEDINRELLRRQEGYGSGGRMNIERDEVQITSGVAAGLTTGAPIAMTVENRDYKNWREKDIAPMTTPRPGHADLTGAVKYGYRDLRVSLERASARETTMRVAAGAIARKLLAEFGIVVGGYVTQIGGVVSNIDAALSYPNRTTCARPTRPPPSACTRKSARRKSTRIPSVASSRSWC
jgi:chorismate synthase